jgi:hypothetical protein
MTKEELAALVEILNRCPVTGAERLWLQALIDKLTPKPEPQPESAEQE